MIREIGRPALHRSFGLRILAAMAIGLALGLAARAIGPGTSDHPNGLAQALELTGTIFVQLLKRWCRR